MINARQQRILSIALPVVGGMLTQNVFTLIDTMMIGVLGATSLAAVGVGGFLVFTFQSITLGLSSGVQALTARVLGEGKQHQSAAALNSAFVVMGVFAPIYTAILFFLVPVLIPLLNDDPAVIALAVPYVQARIFGILFVGINFGFRGYWAATEQTRLYLLTFIAMYAINVVLNYGMIFGNFGFPEMGVLGSGIASSLSMFLGTAIYILLANKYACTNGFASVWPDRTRINELLRFSVPYGLQQVFFSMAFVVFYWMVGFAGTDTVAATAVLINLMLFAYLPGIAFGIAAATFVSQCAAKNEWQEARVWARDVMRMALVVLILLGLPCWLAPEFVLSLFIQEPHVIEIAETPLRIAGIFLFTEAIGMVLMQSLHGIGDAKRLMQMSVGVQWLFFLPLTYLVGPVLGLSLVWIWVVHTAYRGIQAAMFYWRWRSKTAG